MVILFLVLAECKIAFGWESLAIIPLAIIAIKTISTDMAIRILYCMHASYFYLYFRYVSAANILCIGMILFQFDRQNNTRVLSL